jgi:hypothetical protein
MKMKPLIALTIILGLGAAVQSHADASGDDMPKWTQTPCKVEDSSNCFWDSGERGNHSGHSFFSIRVEGKDCIVYWDDRYARHHNHCI